MSARTAALWSEYGPQPRPIFTTVTELPNTVSARREDHGLGQRLWEKGLLRVRRKRLCGAGRQELPQPINPRNSHTGLEIIATSYHLIVDEMLGSLCGRPDAQSLMGVGGGRFTVPKGKCCRAACRAREQPSTNEPIMVTMPYHFTLAQLSDQPLSERNTCVKKVRDSRRCSSYSE